MSAPLTKYRAKARCVAGGAFREIGDIFECAKIPVCPKFLEVVSADEIEAAKPKEDKAKKAAKPKEGAGVTPADMGIGVTPVSSGEVTSADILKDR